MTDDETRLPFRYVGGDACVDFVNTVHWTGAGPAAERLADYRSLTEWAEGAGLLTGAAGKAFREEARGRARDARAALESAHLLRAALHEAYVAVASGAPSAAALAAFDRQLSGVLAHLRVAPGGVDDAGPARWGWRGWEGRLDAVLWPVAWRAALLLTGPDARRLRVCAGLDCGWVYVDRSRNGLRRWCEMETCGTREKSRRRRELK